MAGTPVVDPAATSGAHRPGGPNHPPPEPSPFDAGYTPAPDEKQDTFRCNGIVMTGYPGACVDFQAKTPGEKWVTTIGSWLGAKESSFKKMLVHAFFNDGKGYGFIAPDGGGNDAFVHISALENSGMQTLRENQRVTYDLQEDRRGKMAAVNLKSADAASEQPSEPQAE